MKAASGELSLTVITVIAIAAVMGAFWALWPKIQESIGNQWEDISNTDSKNEGSLFGNK